nr:hypothetical protein [Tanacetum cinerariifolium]
ERGWDTWDREQDHMVLLGECFGTVQVSVGAQECRVGEKGDLGGNGG